MVDVLVGGLSDVQGFADWLVAHGYDALVGWSCDPECCPLACWLADVYGGRWSVGPGGYTCVDDRSLGGGLPWWAAQFFWAIDRQFGGLVTASAAYAVLLDLVPDLREAWIGG